MKDSTQKSREFILGRIPGTMLQLHQEVDSRAIRILGDTPTGLLDPEDYLGSIRPFVAKIQESLAEYRPDCKTTFLAVKICRGKHSYFAVDLNNVDYDYDTAHHCKTPIPVYVLRLSKRNPTIYRKEAVDGTIAATLACMHDWHGYDPLPLVDNYNDPNMQYGNPRSLQEQ